VAAVTGRRFSSFAEDWERYGDANVRAAGVELAPDVLRDRIDRRVRAMLDAGLVEEVRGLVEHGRGQSLTSAQAIGYAEIVDHLAGRMTLEDALLMTAKRTRALARRQVAWFRRDPRIRWFRAGPEGAGGIVDQIEEYLRGS
jgi:tRNA dimethylallyltransferase